MPLHCLVHNKRACTVYFPTGDPPPVAKPAVAPAEKREECDNSEPPSEIRSPRRMQPLAKSTQTEESSPNQTQPPCFPDGRGNKNRFGLEKRNSPPPLAGAGRKWAEGSEVEREEELKEVMDHLYPLVWRPPKAFCSFMWQFPIQYSTGL
ncbi:3-hydroxyisobutyrate dehydrogenase [Platysternon megacephalum]|uniref:3-hydroxyisobutyrate dehydrogenase n=1 Tax=Platysternon megacephalum TaxID=55544 RepID=A0A4D9DHD7_9SAUR|nr:3-hydroxyisobutyrate dehydrogenase [Platysternon megacephalum]